MFEKELHIELRLRFGLSRPVQSNTALRRTPAPVAHNNKDVQQCHKFVVLIPRRRRESNYDQQPQPLNHLVGHTGSRLILKLHRD